MGYPSSIGIIPDGNRRFAKRLLASPNMGHEWGAEKIQKIYEWCKEFDIKAVTFYALSLENINKRPKAELSFIYRLLEKEIDSYLEPDSMIFKDNIKVVFFGRIELVPGYLKKKIRQIMKITKNHKGAHVNFAVAYGGRQEILNATKKIAKQVKSGLSPAKITHSLFKQNLQTNGSGDPELVIRTGGDKRISNFLLYQSAYSEFAFLDKMWPEITKKDFAKVVNEFASRDRRFGK